MEHFLINDQLKAYLCHLPPLNPLLVLSCDITHCTDLLLIRCYAPPPPTPSFVALARGTAINPRPVSHRDLRAPKAKCESSGGRRGVMTFTLCTDQALQPVHTFPPVVTHGKGKTYQTLHRLKWFCFCKYSKCFKRPGQSTSIHRQTTNPGWEGFTSFLP